MEASTFLHCRVDYNIKPMWCKFVNPAESYYNLLLFIGTLEEVAIVEDLNYQVYNYNMSTDNVER